MSSLIAIVNLSTKDKQTIQTQTALEHRKCYKKTKDGFVSLPFAYSQEYSQKATMNTSPCVEFKGQLRPEQQNVHNQVVAHFSNICPHVIIKARPGFGKTIIAISLACYFPTTMIVTKSVLLREQWRLAIDTFAPRLNITITSLVLLQKEHDRTLVDFLIVDELHQLVTDTAIDSLLNIQPKFILSLSATPYRPDQDPFQKCIDLFFGQHTIGHNLFARHTVYLVPTCFYPAEIRLQSNGKLDWNFILNQQMECRDRNQLIVDSILQFPDRCWLVLIKRVKHAQLLQHLFEQTAPHLKIDTLTGTKKTFDRSCHILIGTTSKIGVGFDHPPINALCIAADVVTYLQQFLGRCMRSQDNNPIVLEFEDRFKPLKKHGVARLEQYKQFGGIIKPL